MMNTAEPQSAALPHKPSSAAHSTKHHTAFAQHAQKENGRSTGAVNGGNDSEAETDILSGDEKPRKKTRPTEPARGHPESRRSSLAGPPSERDRKRVNGNIVKRIIKHRPADKATSSSSRAQSADASLSTPSSDSASAYGTSDREVRQSLSVEPRKRKLSDDHNKSREPPRQRPRLDSAARKRMSSPGSNPPLSAGHKRSISNQSGIARVTSRKRRDASTTSHQSEDHKKWADDSSEEEDSSPQRKERTIPHLAPPRRNAVFSQRALTSPARTNAAHSRRGDKYGTTPLAKASERGHLDAVKKAALQYPEEINQEDNGGFTPLQKAALEGHDGVVKFLLEKGANKDCCSKEERDTPLIDAVENSHVKVIRLLLDAKVNPHHSNKRGVRAIDAINHENENAEVIESLLKSAMAAYQPADGDLEDESAQDSPISHARREGGLRPDLLYQALTVENLQRYCTSGDLEAVGMLLESVEPTVACAVAAARGGHLTALELLLASAKSMERDPSPSKYEETPLLVAIGRGHLKVIELLLNQDNFNPCRRTKDGKAYWEVAEERKGPRWQAERDLLKARFDRYKGAKESTRKRDISVVVSKSQTVKDSSPKSPRISKIIKIRRAGQTGSSVADEDRDKKKRLSSSSTKDLLQKESGRGYRRVVDEDESSDGAASDEEPFASKKRLQSISKAGRKSSTSGAVPSSSHKQHKEKDREELVPSSPRLGKSGRNKLLRVKREEADDDNDEEVAMVDVAAPANGLGKRKRERIEAAEIKAREEAEAQLRVEAELREREEQQAAEAAREAKRRKREADDEAARKKREEYLSGMPIMLRRALEKGLDRPMLSRFPDEPHDYSKLVPGTESSRGVPFVPRRRRLVGVKDAFLPLVVPLWEDLDHDLQDKDKMAEQFISAHHAVGILGLPTLDVTKVYPEWTTLPMTREQLTKFVKAWDTTKLQSERFLPAMGQYEYDIKGAPLAAARCKEQLIGLADELRWVRLSDFRKTFEELRAKDERLRQLGELTVMNYQGLRRPRPPGYDPKTDPRMGWKKNEAVRPGRGGSTKRPLRVNGVGGQSSGSASPGLVANSPALGSGKGPTPGEAGEAEKAKEKGEDGDALMQG